MIKNTDLQRWFICNERVLIGLSYVASAGQITGRVSGTREGGDEASSPFLSSCVLDICSFAPTKKSYDYYNEGGLLWNLYSRVKVRKNLAGGGGEGRGINGLFMLHWFF